MTDNNLYYGDNLDILRRYVRDESVDLVYLDPPFNSAQDYNVLFAEKDGSQAAAQIQAFEDTWEWGREAADSYEQALEAGGRVAEVLRAFRAFLGDSNMLAYLAMMAPRLSELHRTLKPTGSLYLHCDPTASHYLKMLLDAVFGPQRFANEIIWKRTSSHSGSKKWGPVHDVILFYTKGPEYTWNQAYQPLPQETIDKWYNNVDQATGRAFNRADLTGAGTRTGSSGKPWRGVDPTSKGRHWAIPRYLDDVVGGMDTHEALDALDAAGYIHWPKSSTGTPMLRRFLDESKGVPAGDVISDIFPARNTSSERLGYPTQKPEALLERIIAASSDETHVVLDPFCGCGTAVAVAHRLKRRWIGIDITHLAVGLIKSRLADAFGPEVRSEYGVIGEPTSVDGAAELARTEPFQFQAWALGLVGARVATSAKKGADKGIDGRLYFHDQPGKTKQVILSVKAGGISVPHVRDLVGVLDREGAQIGALISMANPTGPMKKEAASAGFYTTPWGKHPRVQLLTVAELLDGRHLDYPARGSNVTFKKAKRFEGAVEQGGLFSDPAPARRRPATPVVSAEDE